MGADVEIDAANITEAEAKTYNNVREPQIMQTVRAQYLGRYGRDLQYSEIYELQMERLQMGRPVKIVVNGQKLEYNDIHAFYKAWKVVSNA